eukprot:3941041-Rhodomonas_salina.1
MASTDSYAATLSLPDVRYCPVSTADTGLLQPFVGRIIKVDEEKMQVLDPRPYTIHHTPYTIHHTPYTIDPGPRP